MKLGIIGSGLIVQEFLPKLVKLPGMEVVAVQGVPECRDEVVRLCETNGVPNACTDYEELLALDIDTVYIAVPNFLHFMYCRKSLENGLNVIVEKPITSNYAEALELKKLAQEKQLFLFEAVTTAYLGNYHKIRQWLPQIGTVKMVNLSYCQYSRRYDAFRAGQTLPAFDPKKSGGALMDLNLYNLHFATGLFGEPKNIRYSANVERDIDTSGTLVLEYEGFVATCTAAKDCSGPYVFVISGTDGYITCKYPPNLIGEVTLHRNDKSTETYDDGMAMERLIPEFTAFIDAVNRNDLKFCYEMLDKSLLVSKLQTKARLDAGIVFPCDR